MIPEQPVRSRTRDVPEDQPDRERSRAWIIPAGVALVVAAGAVLRFWSVPPLWLDEAQSVAIARLPLPELFQALREDGSPPLYYLLLHAWTAAFGTGEFVVRSLSGVISTATLPLWWLAGTRLLGSRRAGWVTLALAASNPWLIRYATETRMYSLVVALSLLVVLATDQVRRNPTVRSGALLAAAAVLLQHTHYWALFLLTAVGGLALARYRRGDRRASAVTLLALLAAAALFLPWLPSLLFQAAHTGTPWADPPHPDVFLWLLQEWSAANIRAASWTALLVLPLVLLGYGGVTRSGRSVELSLRGHPDTRWLAWLGAATMLVAYAATTIGSSAYAGRYTAVVVGLVLLLAAAGITRLPHQYAGWLTALLVACWITAGPWVGTAPRSQAMEVATVLNARSAPDDLVLYCPDQLGPAVTRLLRTPSTRLGYPTGADPARVNWVDYRERNLAASPTEFARSVVARTPASATIWLVRSDGYRTYEDSCPALSAQLSQLRGPARQVLGNDRSFYEHAGVWQWPGRSGGL